MAQIVTAPGPGRPADIHVYDGAGNLLLSFRAFEDSYLGGVSVAVGDVNRDGIDEIAVGTLGGTPRVRVFDPDGIASGYGATVTPFTGLDRGVEVAVADLRGNGQASVIAAAATGANPPLAVIDPELGTVQRVVQPLPNGTSGLRVAAGDLNHDGRDEVVVAPGFGGDSTIRVLGPNLVQQSAFRANTYNGVGYNVAVATRLGLPILAQPVTSTFTVRRRLTRLVARFVDAGAADTLPTARIVWSDGASTGGVVAASSADTFDVRATRRFTKPGRLHLTVTLSRGDGRTSVARSVVIVRRS